MTNQQKYDGVMNELNTLNFQNLETVLSWLYRLISSAESIGSNLSSVWEVVTSHLLAAGFKPVLFEIEYNGKNETDRAEFIISCIIRDLLDERSGKIGGAHCLYGNTYQSAIENWFEDYRNLKIRWIYEDKDKNFVDVEEHLYPDQIRRKEHKFFEENVLGSPAFFLNEKTEQIIMLCSWEKKLEKEKPSEIFVRVMDCDEKGPKYVWTRKFVDFNDEWIRMEEDPYPIIDNPIRETEEEITVGYAREWVGPGMNLRHYKVSKVITFEAKLYKRI